MRTQRLDIFNSDELKHFQDGRVEKVVSVIVANQGIDNRKKQVAFYDVSVIELIFEINYLPHEPH